MIARTLLAIAFLTFWMAIGWGFGSLMVAAIAGAAG